MIYNGAWNNVEGMIRDFEMDVSELDGAEILYASYDCGDYDGQAFVFFKRNGSLWEVNASHCSCYGLEGQWSPEEVYPEAMKRRLQEAYWYDTGVRDFMKKYFKIK